ncbi:probable E3 ubiquitin-protein ligase RNF217 [Tanacetum coccineum]
MNSNRCSHSFCTACVIKYIRVKLEDNVLDIKCPHTSCNHSLEPLSCRTKIAHKLFNKWCDVLCESTVLGFDKVYCPNNECSELILNEFGDGDVKRCKPGMETMSILILFARGIGGTGRGVPSVGIIFSSLVVAIALSADVELSFATGAENKYHSGIHLILSITVAQPMKITMI